MRHRPQRTTQKQMRIESISSVTHALPTMRAIKLNIVAHFFAGFYTLGCATLYVDRIRCFENSLRAK